MPRLSDANIARILREENAIHVESHFVGTSGKHLDAYVDKDRLGRNPLVLDQFAYELTNRLCEGVELSSKGENVVAVIGAPMGAVVLANRVAFWINERFPREDGIMIQAIYAEKSGATLHDTLKIRPSFAKLLVSGAGVISIEDILNTGGTAEEMLKVIREAGGVPRRLGAICNRGGITATKLGVPVVTSLMNVSLSAYEASACPMCLAGVPVRTDLGHGAKFLAELAGRESAKQT